MHPNPVTLLSLCIQGNHCLLVASVPYSESGILFRATWTPGKPGSHAAAAAQRRDWLATNGYVPKRDALNRQNQAVYDRVLAKHGATRLPGSQTGYRGRVNRETVDVQHAKTA